MDSFVSAQEPITVIVRHTKQIAETARDAAGQPLTPSKWSAIAFAFARGANASLRDYEAYAMGDTKTAAELAARQKAETGLRRQLLASR